MKAKPNTKLHLSIAYSSDLYAHIKEGTISNTLNRESPTIGNLIFFYIESVQNCLEQGHNLNQINLEMLQVFHSFGSSRGVLSVSIDIICFRSFLSSKKMLMVLFLLLLIFCPSVPGINLVSS